MTAQVGNWMFGAPSKPTKHGAVFLALDPGVMTSQLEFGEKIASLIDEVRGAETADSWGQVMVPGQRE